MPSLRALLPKLLEWYGKGARPLPWRQGPVDPYRVWISEVMSQQSTMVTVLPYFSRWMEAYPALHDLAAANEAQLMKLWAGLGYYSRARNVLKSAQILSARIKAGGEWPRRQEEWLALPGVGPYTAAAVRAIALNEPVLPVDGNVIRVGARFWGVADPLNRSADKGRIVAEIERLAGQAPPNSHSRLAQTLMELGSQICRPGEKALCDLCPLKSGCHAYRAQTVAQVPAPKRRPAPKKIHQVALLYRNRDNAVLLRQIPPGQRLEDQWELPHFESNEVELATLRRHFPLPKRGVSHAITRYRYQVYALDAGHWPEQKAPPGHRFWRPGEPWSGTITTLTRKLVLKEEGT